MNDRVIIHSDLNSFYASVECLYNPKIRNYPVAVAGDVEQRHGIILAKNEIAKKYKIQTGEAIWQAKTKCKDLIVVQPHYDLYHKFSKVARQIYEQYTEQVEAFGMDECWLDVTKNPQGLNGEEIADKIREQIKFELGVTASAGVSYNKIFAKLGSDLKKPDATSVIQSNDYKAKIWHLPANELLNVGPSTYQKLYKYGIYTIGDLATSSRKFLETAFGKWGSMLWTFANGYDNTPVSNVGAEGVIKSIGNSATMPHDLETDTDVKIALHNLAESVSARLREHGFVCKTVQLYVRDKNLTTYERQTKLKFPNRTSTSLAETAFRLYKENHFSGIPIRCIGVRACDLIVPEYYQLSMIPNEIQLEALEKVESTIDKLRERFGHKAVRKAIMLLDTRLSALDAKNENIIHPVSYL